MEWLCKLREICNKLYSTTNDKKYLIISQVLLTDDCFFKMDMNTALAILKDLEIAEPLAVYKELVSPNSYKEIKQIFTITG